MPDKRFDVLGVGLTTLDIIQTVDRYPEEGSTLGICDEFLTIGGSVGRSMVACARIGARAGLVGMIGQGVYADMLRRELQNETVVSKLITDAAAPSSQRSMVILTQSTGARTIFWQHQPRANADCIRQGEALLAQATCVLLDPTDIDLCYAIAQTARDMGVTTIMDTSSYRSHAEKILPYIDHINAPEKFFAARAREHGQTPDDNMIALLRATGAQSVISTMGERGGRYVLKGHADVSRYDAEPVLAVDTCGAGDVFHAGFAYGMSQSFDIETAIGFGAFLAAKKCAAFGFDGLPASLTDFKSR